MTLFNSKTIQNAATSYVWQPTADEAAAAREWAEMASDPAIELKNESQLRATRIFQDTVSNGNSTPLSLPGMIAIDGGLPLVVDGKLIGAIGYADGMNWYNYVGGDPVNFTDPSGLAQTDEGDIVVTAE